MEEDESEECFIEEEIYSDVEDGEDIDELDDWLFEDLFHKNTKSFQCLAQVEISRSSLLRDPLYHFPEIDDPNLYDALWSDDPPAVYDDIGVERYIDLCKEAGIKPFRRVVKSLPTDTLDLKFYALTEPQMRTICQTLEHNKYIKNLILQENFFSPQSLEHLVPVIINNKTIACLDLKLCQIGQLGAEVLEECFRLTKSITYLDLSHNNLGDEGLSYLVECLTDNSSIQILNLSNNGLGEIALNAIGEMLSDNYTIKDLDLSWNYFYSTPGIKGLFEGIKENLSLTHLNLAWNGIGDPEQFKFVFQYLKSENTKVKHINFSNNRITGPAVKMLRAGLRKNESVETLDLSYNPLKSEEIQILCGAYFDTLNPIQYINFGESWVDKSCLGLLNRIKRNERKVDIGGIFSNHTIVGPNVKEVLLNRAKFVAMNVKKKKMRKDIGQIIIMFKDDEEMTKEEFLAMVKKNKIKWDKDLTDMIIKTFTMNKKVNLNNIKETYMRLYPDTQPPEPKKKKGKGKKGKKGKGKKAGEDGAPVPPGGEGVPPTEGAQPAEGGEGVRFVEGAESIPPPEEVEGEGEGEEGEDVPPSEGAEGEEGEQLPEGEKPPEEGEKPPEEGEKPPEEGDKPPEDEKPPEGEPPQTTEAPSEGEETEAASEPPTKTSEA